MAAEPVLGAAAGMSGLAKARASAGALGSRSPSVYLPSGIFIADQNSSPDSKYACIAQRYQAYSLRRNALTVVAAALKSTSSAVRSGAVAFSAATMYDAS